MSSSWQGRLAVGGLPPKQSVHLSTCRTHQRATRPAAPLPFHSFSSAAAARMRAAVQLCCHICDDRFPVVRQVCEALMRKGLALKSGESKQAGKPCDWANPSACERSTGPTKQQSTPGTDNTDCSGAREGGRSRRAGGQVHRGRYMARLAARTRWLTASTAASAGERAQHAAAASGSPCLALLCVRPSPIPPPPPFPPPPPPTPPAHHSTASSRTAPAAPPRHWRRSGTLARGAPAAACTAQHQSR